ncbi:MAG: hypothetical protein P9M07_01995 [Candidatus Aceula meridiana]|nr:hypothetical protein [Candidatus Aceula meridiana]
MDEIKRQMEWDEGDFKKFELMIAKIPLFHRDIAHVVVLQKAEINAKERNSAKVEQDDIVSAFLTEVPKAFYSLMIRLMDEVGFNYQRFLPKEK